MAVFDLEERVEDAVKAVITGLNISGVNSILLAQEKAEVIEPAILITLPSSDIPEDEHALERPTGNRSGLLTVGIKSHSDFGRANHRQMVAAVRDLFYDDDFVSSLNTVSDGVVVDRIEPQSAERTKDDGNSFLTGIQAEVWFRTAPAGN